MDQEKNLYYFFADVHLGLDYMNPSEREKKFSSLLYTLPSQTKEVFLLGDIFDFWYEYKDVIPRGFTRTLGAIAALVDRGVKVHFFNGNHDIWTYDYLQNEVGVIMEEQPKVLEICGKRFCMAHGDGLLKDDMGYSFLSGIFHNGLLQTLFSGIHPRWAFLLGHTWSKHNRLTHCELSKEFTMKENLMVETCKKFSNEFQLRQPEGEKIDYFIFGHYHVRSHSVLENGGELFTLGEWIHNPDYLVFDGDLISEHGVI